MASPPFHPALVNSLPLDAPGGLAGPVGHNLGALALEGLGDDLTALGQDNLAGRPRDAVEVAAVLAEEAGEDLLRHVLLLDLVPLDALLQSSQDLVTPESVSVLVRLVGPPHHSWDMTYVSKSIRLGEDAGGGVALGYVSHVP